MNNLKHFIDCVLTEVDKKDSILRIVMNIYKEITICLFIMMLKIDNIYIFYNLC